jgi:hypothetical protein
MQHDPETMQDPEAQETAQLGEINDDLTIRNQAGGREFKGKPLQPWTPMRQAAAQRMGLRYGRVPQAEIESFQQTGAYDGLFADAVMSVWLCLQNNSRVMKAYRLPDEAFIEAMNWADKEHIIYPSATAGELALKFLEIVSDVGRVTGSYKEPSGSPRRPKNSSRRRG